MKLAFYISGHGFGHISRSSVVIDALLNSFPKLEILVCSERIDFLKDHERLTKRKFQPDVGIHQKDSLTMDLETTKSLLQQFSQKQDSLLRSETKFLQNFDPEVILTDASSFPILLGLETGIPSVFLGNFTWDFIYSAYSSLDPIFEQASNKLRVEYTFANKALIYPFSCPTPFDRKKQIGLVGRKPTLSKENARTYFGFSPDKKYFLLSFGAYGLDASQFVWEKLPKDCVVVTNKLPSFSNYNVLAIEDCYYPDLVTACDTVVTKPGYGILSETYFANTPIFYTERGDFPEYPVLVKEMGLHHHAKKIEFEELYSFKFTSMKADLPVNESPKLQDGTKDVLEELEEYL